MVCDRIGQLTEGEMSNKYLVIAIILLLIAAVGGVVLWFLIKSGKPLMGTTPSMAPVLTPTVEPTLVPTSEPTVPAEEPEEKSALEQIKEAFAEKYHKPIQDVEVNISKNTGTHASGGVKFAGEMGGAMWLAYNDGGSWLLVFDGQGTIPCTSIEPYNFPIEMVPECWDEATSKSIKRS